MKNTNISLVILTCEARYGTVGKTLQSVLESDWRGTISIVSDKVYTDSPDSFTRVNEAFRGILEDFYASGKGFLLYLEDDVTVNKYLQHNISAEINLDTHCITLCDWGDMQSGAQGLLLSRDFVRRFLEIEWLAIFDGVMYKFIEENNIPHSKCSLVQHNEGNSAITGVPTPYYAVNFDPDYKR